MDERRKLADKLHDKMKQIIYPYQMLTVSNLQTIPIENLRNLVNVPIDECVTIWQFIQKAENAGALSFEPYQEVLDERTSPILRVNWNTYIFLNELGRFDATNWAGVSSVLDNCSLPLDKMILFFQNNGVTEELSYFAYTMFLASLVDCCAKFPEFMQFYYSNPQAVDNYLKSVLDYCGINLPNNPTIKDVAKYITNSEEIHFNGRDQLYAIMKDDEVYAYCMMNKTAVSVRTSNGCTCLKLEDLFTEHVSSPLRKIMSECNCTITLLFYLLEISGIYLDVPGITEIRGKGKEPLMRLPYLRIPKVVRIRSSYDLFDAVEK